MENPNEGNNAPEEVQEQQNNQPLKRKERELILCKICNKVIPSLALVQKENDIYVIIKCIECNHKEEILLGDYLLDIKNMNKVKTYYCQKKDGSHSTKEATGFLYGDKSFCEECIDNFKNYLDEVKIISLDEYELGLIENKCRMHNDKKFKYYCFKCEKHFCELCNIKEHIYSKHDICELDKFIKSFDSEEFQKKIDIVENYILEDLLLKKNQVVESLKKLINNIEELYQKYLQRNLQMLKLGRIIQKNFQELYNLPTYNQIMNAIEFTTTIFKKDAPEIKEASLEDIGTVMNNYNLLKTYFTTKNNLKENFMRDSVILKNDAETKLMKGWLDSKGNVNKAKLIYKATTDGDSYDAFYEKCGNKGPTLSLFQTKKGRRFGGFTKGKWIKGKKTNQNDKDAFLFSLDNKMIYTVANPNYAICSNLDKCQLFGNSNQGDGLQISTSFLSQPSQEDETMTKCYNFNSPYELNDEFTFILKEMEVYEIEFC